VNAITGAGGAVSLTASHDNATIAVTAPSAAATLTVTTASIDIEGGGTIVLTGDGSSNSATLLLIGGSNAAALVIDTSKATAVTTVGVGSTKLEIGGADGKTKPAEIKINNASIKADPSSTVSILAAANSASSVTLVGTLGGGATPTTTDLSIVSDTVAADKTTIRKGDGILASS
jgi:hypothetical protein